MKKLLFLLCLGLFFSCRVETFETWEISNNTSGNIKVRFYDNSSTNEKSFDIPQNENAIIKKYNFKSKNPETINPGIVFNSFIITNSLSDTCSKNYKLTENWVVIDEMKSPPTKYYNHYTFSVSDGDF